MAWLAKVLGRDESREVEEIVQPAPPSKPSKPPLLLLVSDASGMAALRMLAFEEAHEACDYIEFWYPNRSAGTVYAIWALPAEPSSDWPDDPDQRGEAVILVRDERRKDVVYPFSFANLDAAWAFLRTEMEKDLDLERVMIYWAVPIDIEMDSAGKIQVSPDVPPAAAIVEFETADEAVVEADEAEVVEVAAGVAAAEGEDEADEAEAAIDEAVEVVAAEVPEIEVVAEEEALEAPPVEQPRTRFVYHDEAAENEDVNDEDVMEAAERMFEDDGDDVPTDIGLAEDEADVDEEDAASEPVEAVEDGHDEEAEDEVLVVEEVEPIEALPELVVERFGAPYHDTEFVEAPAHDEDAPKANGNGHSEQSLNEALVDGEEIKIDEIEAKAASVDGDKCDGDEDPQTEAEGQIADEQTKSSRNGHAEASVNGHAVANGKAKANGNGHAVANGNGRHISPKLRSLPDEITRVLDGRKLNQQDGPFKGFNSPRGRF